MDLDPATMTLLFFIFVLAMLLGVELIRKVPSQLHTPLMSGSNAISGITIVGALIAAGRQDSAIVVTVLGTLAVTFAMINVVGGYLVTDRMLKMFKRKDKQ
jgi:NAD(P) transhydrogenase subunit alpha